MFLMEEALPVAMLRDHVFGWVPPPIGSMRDRGKEGINSPDSLPIEIENDGPKYLKLGLTCCYDGKEVVQY